jgi:hypothetical protein
LEVNPLPDVLQGLLPDDFRVYCLALKALKQWLAAEQAAADRYLLGGKAQQACLDAADSCVVTGEPVAGDEITLHYPVHDGRPPIPIKARPPKTNSLAAGVRAITARLGEHNRNGQRPAPRGNPPLAVRETTDIRRATTMELIRELCARDISCVVSIADDTGATFCATTPHRTEKQRQRLKQQCKLLLTEIGANPQASLNP